MPLPTNKITIPLGQPLRPEQRYHMDELEAHAREGAAILADAERLAEAARLECQKERTPANVAKWERAKALVETARTTSKRLNREAANALRGAIMTNRQEPKESYEN